MNYVSCAQGSAEWFEARCGRVTASHMADVLAVLKCEIGADCAALKHDKCKKKVCPCPCHNGSKSTVGESAARLNYKLQLMAEVCTGQAQDTYVSPAMQWGIEQEVFARAAYEIANDVTVEQVGFFIHPKIDRAGASPDGVVGKDGLLEIKCPNTVTHLQYILEGVVPEEYQPQMLWQMACSGRKWCDFASFDSRMPKHLQLFVKRFMRDDARIAEYEQAVEQFLCEMDSLMLRLPTASAAVDEEIFAEPKCKTGCNSPAVLNGYCDQCNELRDEARSANFSPDAEPAA